MTWPSEHEVKDAIARKLDAKILDWYRNLSATNAKHGEYAVFKLIMDYAVDNELIYKDTHIDLGGEG
jgi:hypothetical protein